MTIETEESALNQDYFWYVGTQNGRTLILDGEPATRDQEILSRYEAIIKYFERNPKRLSLRNRDGLTSVWCSDAILKRDEHLRERLKSLLFEGETQ